MPRLPKHPTQAPDHTSFASPCPVASTHRTCPQGHVLRQLSSNQPMNQDRYFVPTLTQLFLHPADQAEHCRGVLNVRPQVIDPLDLQDVDQADNAVLEEGYLRSEASHR